MSSDQGAAAASSGNAGSSSRASVSREVKVGGYGGVAHTYRSAVKVNNPGRTNMTMTDFDWIGQPFKSPIYYGLRAMWWGSVTPFGGMLDFTHAKAIAKRDDTASFSGTLNGQKLAEKAKVGDVFKHMEFSHGHNMVTLNAMARMGALVPRLRPYVGVGAGVSLPHTEIGFRTENGRTYEYQFAGFVAQGVAGIEVPLGRASVFLEYKFSYAPYDVPLSGVTRGWLLVTDLWRQLRARLSGEKPPGGRLSTTLASHHGIGGVLVRVSGPPVP
jgi:opacity protein-like surface antigen